MAYHFRNLVSFLQGTAIIPEVAVYPLNGRTLGRDVSRSGRRNPQAVEHEMVHASSLVEETATFRSLTEEAWTSSIPIVSQLRFILSCAPVQCLTIWQAARAFVFG